jgi:VCBS repeat-containing protein
VSSVIVVAHTLGQLALPQQGQGVFGAEDQLPSVPFFLHNRSFRVDFIATAPDGRSSSVTIPITLR